MTKIYSINDCQEVHLAKGFCGKHYRSQYLGKRECSKEYCKNMQHATGFCYSHWLKQREKKCSLDKCQRPYHGKGLCKNHYDIQKRKTDPEYKKKQKAKGKRWTQKHPEYLHNRYLVNNIQQMKLRLAKRDELMAYLKNWRKEHQEEQKQNAIDKYVFLREACIDHYSGGKMCCKKCGEKEYVFLTIDHIQNRKHHGHDRKFGSFKLYRTLWSKNFPEGYQVLCYNCNMIKEFDRKRKEHKYSNNKATIREVRYGRKLKLDVMQVYCGDKIECQCCGFDNTDGLSIDHIAGRKQSDHPKGFGSKQLYKFLKREKFPKGFQVLCINCNSAKGKLEQCPHEKIEKMNDYE